MEGQGQFGGWQKTAVKQLTVISASSKPPAVFALDVLGELLETSVWR